MGMKLVYFFSRNCLKDVLAGSYRSVVYHNDVSPTIVISYKLLVLAT